MSTFRQAWAQTREKHYAEIMADTLAKSMVCLGDRALAEQDAEIAQLKAQLDSYQGRTVLFCTHAAMPAAAEASRAEQDGTILRATDTGAEFELANGIWLPR